ncbi:MAG: cell filamentation protein Fic [Rhodobacteraceae bacterium]|nr:cell filamentation protein Fic [Paracoccaceae bacterium]
MNETHLYYSLGFTWRKPVLPEKPHGGKPRALFRFQQSLVAFVHDASSLEGNPFTYPEVKALIEGIPVVGHKIEDERQVLNLAESTRELFYLVENNQFSLAKPVSDRLHEMVAKMEALEWGHFRGEGEETSLTPYVALGYGSYHPPPTEPGGGQLTKLYHGGLAALGEVRHPYERAMAYFLFAALHQFYFDGNKRTGRFMMNGELVSNGWDAISVPATRAQEFNELMVEFYQKLDGSDMMVFLYDCRPRDVPKQDQSKRPKP